MAEPQHTATSVDELLGLFDEAFVDQLYRSLLGREPDDVGRQGHLAELRRGRPKADFILHVADSAEGRAFGATLEGLQDLRDHQPPPKVGPMGRWLASRAEPAGLAMVTDIAAAENRLGRAVHGLGADLHRLHTDVHGQGTNLQSLDEDVHGLGAEVRGLGADVRGLGAAVHGLGADVHGLQAQLQRLQPALLGELQTTGGQLTTHLQALHDGLAAQALAQAEVQAQWLASAQSSLQASRQETAQAVDAALQPAAEAVNQALQGLQGGLGQLTAQTGALAQALADNARHIDALALQTASQERNTSESYRRMVQLAQTLSRLEARLEGFELQLGRVERQLASPDIRRSPATEAAVLALQDTVLQLQQRWDTAPAAAGAPPPAGAEARAGGPKRGRRI